MVDILPTPPATYLLANEIASPPIEAQVSPQAFNEEEHGERAVKPRTVWERNQQQARAKRAQTCGFNPKKADIRLVSTDALGE